jgi:hypothetical protein
VNPSDEIERLKGIVRSQEAALAHWRREADQDAGTIARLSRELDAVLKHHEYAAPIQNAYAAPAVKIDPGGVLPHPFYVVEGNCFCGECGGGILHPVHQTPAK